MAANVVAPSGFQTIRRVDGVAPNYAMTENYIAFNNGNRINYGDPVKRLSTGYIDVMGTGGSTILGIFRGCRYVDPNTLKTEFYPAWKTPTLGSAVIVYALVDTDPFMVFQAQMVGTALTVANIGQNIDITTSSSGSTSSAIGLSVCSLNASPATTATFPFKILSIVGLNGPGGGAATPAINALYNPTFDNNWIEVTMNTNSQLQTTGI